MTYKRQVNLSRYRLRMELCYYIQLILLLMIIQSTCAM